MDWTKYGYVIASEYRKKIILCLSEAPKSPKKVSEETGLYISHVSHIINDLIRKGLVECLTPTLKRGKIFTLTSDGKDIADQLKRLR